MDWNAIGAIGEILGAAAVVLTLAYLAGQVRVARSTAADTSRLTRVHGVREQLLTTASHDAVLESTVKAYRADSFYDRFGETFSLSPMEAARLDFMHQAWFWLHWGHFSSTNDPRDLDELAHVISGFYAVPAVRYSWDHSPFGKPYLDAGFVAFVDEALAAADRAGGGADAASV